MSDEKKMTDYVTREMYRQIKSMNREQMCNFLYNLYPLSARRPPPLRWGMNCVPA